MSRKHNVKKTKSKGGYARRLARDGLTTTPRMKYTGLTTEQMVRKFEDEKTRGNTRTNPHPDS